MTSSPSPAENAADAGRRTVAPVSTDSLLDKLPSRLSPSRAKDFKQCPQLFKYKTIDRISEPPSVHAAVGTLSHLVFEKIFDLPRTERTLARALALIGPSWQEMINPPQDPTDTSTDTPTSGATDEQGDQGSGQADTPEREPAAAVDAPVPVNRNAERGEGYRALAPAGSQAEADLLARAEVMVRGWFGMEDPTRFDPEGRELHLQAEVLGVTMHGIIDRLDKQEMPEGTPDRYWISDYKTGKPPKGRYMDEAFFAMRVYALLVRQTMGITPYALRLVHVVAGNRDGLFYQQVTDELLDATARELDHLWRKIRRAAETGEFPPRKSVLCNWCFFQDICPAFATELQGMDVDPSAA